MSEYKYKLTDDDKEDRKKHLTKLIKNVVWLVILWLIFNFKRPISRFLYEITSFLGGLFDLVVIAVEIALLVFLVLAVISAFNYFRRNDAYYKRKSEKEYDKAVKWFERNQELVAGFNRFVEKIKSKTNRFGFDIFDSSVDQEEFYEVSFWDSRHFANTGEEYDVYITRYKQYIFISHMQITLVRFMRVAIELVECDMPIYAEEFVKNIGRYKESLRYPHDKRREGGFIVVAPVANVQASSIGDGSRARITYRSEFGTEHIDICTPSDKDYDYLACLLS